MLLLLKRFVGARALDVVDIPIYMDELDYLEDVYFGKKEVSDEKELAKLRGLYEYSYAMKFPTKPNFHAPYNLLTYLAKVAPKGSEEQYMTEKLRSYGYLQRDESLDESAKRRIEYASNWVADFQQIKEAQVSLDDNEKNALNELVRVLGAEDDAEKIQNAIFNTAKKSGLQPARLFKTIYTVLLGVPQGPRLGPYILAMGKQNVVGALERTLRNQG
jgi:lysyl-tRNA synthetase class 1